MIKERLNITHQKYAKEWHPTLNSLSPSEVSAGSHKKAWWLCQKGHSWEAVIKSRTMLNRGCPVCSGRVVTDSTSLTTLFKEISQEWHPDKNGDLMPSSFTAQSNRKVWWLCKLHKDHEWESTVAHRTNGRGCPFCTGQKVADSNCLAYTNLNLASQWHISNTLKPTDVTLGSHRKVLWKCMYGHIWEATIKNRSRGTGCPRCCESKGEKNISSYLIQRGINFEKEYRFEGCKDRRKLPFDFVINNKLAIEYHVEQHYRFISFGSSKRTTKDLYTSQRRDAIKEQFCKNQNIPLLIIPYWEFNVIEEKLNAFLTVNIEGFGKP